MQFCFPRNVKKHKLQRQNYFKRFWREKKLFYLQMKEKHVFTLIWTASRSIFYIYICECRTHINQITNKRRKKYMKKAKNERNVEEEKIWTKWYKHFYLYWKWRGIRTTSQIIIHIITISVTSIRHNDTLCHNVIFVK